MSTQRPYTSTRTRPSTDGDDGLLRGIELMNLQQAYPVTETDTGVVLYVHADLDLRRAARGRTYRPAREVVAASFQRSRRNMPVVVLPPPSIKTVNTPAVGKATFSARNSGVTLSGEVTSRRAAAAVVTCE